METRAIVQSCRFLGFKDGTVHIEGDGVPRWLQSLAENGRIRVISMAGEKGLYIWLEDDLAEQVLPGETICRDERGRVFSTFLPALSEQAA